MSLELYNINKEIEQVINEYVDEETGEISEEVSKRIDELQLKKEDIIHSLGLTHIINKAESEKVSQEIKRLQSIKKQYDSREASAKRILEKYLYLGETYKFSNLEIKYKKNPPKVITNDDLDLYELKETNPDLVKVEYSLDKMKVKEYAKENKPLPVGISLESDLSLQIK